MSHTLEQLIEVCQTSLSTREGYEGHAQILSFLQRALMEDQFLTQCFVDSNWVGNKIIYQDPGLGFCIRVHINQEPLREPPHDHGSTWAIYGQAEGETEMSEWQRLESTGTSDSVQLKKLHTYHLKRGDVYLYKVGDIHSPARTSGTRLVRIEGVDIDAVEQTSYDQNI